MLDFVPCFRFNRVGNVGRMSMEPTFTGGMVTFKKHTPVQRIESNLGLRRLVITIVVVLPGRGVMRTTSLVPLLMLLVCGTLLVIATSCERGESATGAAPNFADITNIVFKQFESFPGQKTNFTVSASNEIAHLVATINLRKKQPCACGHSQEVVFQKPSGEIRVSFCDHCFDVLDSRNPESYELLRMYRMPKDFYAEYVKLARTQPNWDVPVQ